MADGAADALNWMIDEGGARVRETVTRPEATRPTGPIQP